MTILHYKQAIACDQRFFEAYNNLVGFLNFCQIVNIIVSFCTFAFTVANLNLFLIFYLKGNALKDVGRIDEAIQCYNVGFFFSCSSRFYFLSFTVIELLNLPFFIAG